MFALILGTFAITLAPAPAERATDEARNALPPSLRDPGLGVGPDVKAKLPPPTMPDGLDGAKQKAIITALIKGDYSYDEFTRKSVVAPQLLKIRDVVPTDAKGRASGVDVWFVAYDDKFLGWLVSVGKGAGRGKPLTKEDLAKRKIVPAGENREVFRHVEFDFLGKVRLQATGRVTWAKTDQSVLLAGEVDPRFRGDPEFPNQWQSVLKEGGTTRLGPAHPWDGAAFYLKITRLAEPAGALFVEQHLVFVEPTGWFDGANLLRSKLPHVVQDNVRTMRKEWAQVGWK